MSNDPAKGSNLPDETDAYLAVITLQYKLRLVTFDRDFKRYANLEVGILSVQEVI